MGQEPCRCEAPEIQGYLVTAIQGRLWDSSAAPVDLQPPAASAGVWAESSQLEPIRTYRGGCFHLSCPAPMPLFPPGLVLAVRGPWAVAGGVGCSCMSRVGHGPPTSFAGSPPLPPSRLHLSLSSAGGGVAPTTRGFEDFS